MAESKKPSGCRKILVGAVCVALGLPVAALAVGFTVCMATTTSEERAAGRAEAKVKREAANAASNAEREQSKLVAAEAGRALAIKRAEQKRAAKELDRKNAADIALGKVYTEYLTQCEAWGRNERAFELTGSTKWKQFSSVHYYRADDLVIEHPTLDRSMCKAAYLKGSAASHQRWVDGNLK